MRQLFDQFDTDKSGELEWGEFWNILASLELGLTDDEITEWQKVCYATVTLSDPHCVSRPPCLIMRAS